MKFITNVTFQTWSILSCEMIAYHSFSLSSEVRPLQSCDELVLQPGHDRAVGHLVDDAVSIATRLLRQEFQSGWLLRLTFVRPYPDGHLAAGEGFRDLCAVGRRDRCKRGLGELRDGTRRGILGDLASSTDMMWTSVWDWVRYRKICWRRLRYCVRCLLQFEWFDALHLHRVVVASIFRRKRKWRRYRRRHWRTHRRRRCCRHRCWGFIEHPLFLFLKIKQNVTWNIFDIFIIWINLYVKQARIIF